MTFFILKASEGIRPTLAELERFHQTPDSAQLAAVASTAAASATVAPVGSSGEAVITHCFTPGDVVEVCEGDLKNLRGKIISIEGNTRIVVQPNHSDLREPIPFTPVELRKFFSQGDHVKVGISITHTCPRTLSPFFSGTLLSYNTNLAHFNLYLSFYF